MEYKDRLKVEYDLDRKIWSHFHPDNEGNPPTSIDVAHIWLQSDIPECLLEIKDEKERAEADEWIRNAIKETGIEKEIYGDIGTPVGWEINVAIRSNFAKALKECKEGSDLSSDLRFSFSKADLKELAKLHKARRYRRKIEDLLTDCNFHTARGDFSEGNYEEYLNGA